MARARKYSAKQLTHINPALHQQNSQKDINLLVNTAVQSVLLNKGDTKTILKKVKTDCDKLK